MNEDWSNQTVIWSGADENLDFDDPVWSPDLDGDPSNGYQGAVAVVVSSNTLNATDYQILLIDVDIADLDGDGVDEVSTRVTSRFGTDPNVVPLTALDGVFSYAPSWSPDLDGDPSNGYQGKIAYQVQGDRENSGIGAMTVVWNGDSADPFVEIGPSVEFSFSIPVAEGDDRSSLTHPVWSPDGQEIAYEWTTRIADTQIYPRVFYHIETVRLMPFESKPDPVTGDPTPVLDPVPLIPDPTTRRTVIGPGVLNPDTGEEFATDPILDVTWTPDGSRIAFLPGGVAYTVGSDFDPVNPPPGSEPQRLQGQELIHETTDLSYSPEGQHLLYAARLFPSDYVLRRVDLTTGKSAELLAPSRTRYQDPHWRPFDAATAGEFAVAASTSASTSSRNMAVASRHHGGFPTRTTLPSNIVAIPRGPISRDPSFLWFAWRISQESEPRGVAGIKHLRSPRRP
ncbi:TolB family protein [Tautonia rosea]|uniref:TolB family protein n=1 Tax=Tautonia rosea TaxID=2728037 RepID=UPI001475A46D|nr:PD40 domain-containing protein [Tautonia rosea]